MKIENHILSLSKTGNHLCVKVLSTNQGLYSKYKDNKYTKSYPVNIFTSDISNNINKNILDENKFIGKNYIMNKFDLNSNEFDEIFSK